MPGIIEQPDPTALEPFTELKDGIRHGIERRIRLEDHLELQVFEHPGHVLGIVEWIRQRGRVLIRRIANDERDAALARRG